MPCGQPRSLKRKPTHHAPVLLLWVKAAHCGNLNGPASSSRVGFSGDQAAGPSWARLRAYQHPRLFTARSCRRGGAFTKPVKAHLLYSARSTLPDLFGTLLLPRTIKCVCDPKTDDGFDCHRPCNFARLRQSRDRPCPRLPGRKGPRERALPVGAELSPMPGRRINVGFLPAGRLGANNPPPTRLRRASGQLRIKTVLCPLPDR